MDVQELAETPHRAASQVVGYAEDELAYRERERIFSSGWSYATAAERVSVPGSYAVAPIGHASVVLVRDRAGELRAFKNVCQHRGHEIASGAGPCRALKCPYHSWTYDLQGGLIAAPYMRGKLDFSTVRLSPAAVETVGGVIFANLDASAPTVDGALAAGASLCDGRTLRETHDDTVAADWKTVVERLLARLPDGPLSAEYTWPNHWWLQDPGGAVVLVARVLPDGPGRSRLHVDRYAADGPDERSFELLSEGDGDAAAIPEQVRQFRTRVRAAMGDRESEGT
jgi:nitrite reductase/ring-hydroxylating ferredoxin subunit